MTVYRERHKSNGRKSLHGSEKDAHCLRFQLHNSNRTLDKVARDLDGNESQLREVRQHFDHDD